MHNINNAYILLHFKKNIKNKSTFAMIQKIGSKSAFHLLLHYCQSLKKGLACIILMNNFFLPKNYIMIFCTSLTLSFRSYMYAMFIFSIHESKGKRNFVSIFVRWCCFLENGAYFPKLNWSQKDFPTHDELCSQRWVVVANNNFQSWE